MEEIEQLGAGGFFPVGQGLELGLEVGEGEFLFYGLAGDEGEKGTDLVEIEDGWGRGRGGGSGVSGGAEGEGGAESGTGLPEEAAAPPSPSDRKSTRLNSSHTLESRMPSSA